MIRLHFIAIVILAVGSPVAADGFIQTVAVTGKQAPGYPTGVTYSDLTLGSLNSTGDVGFHAFVKGTSSNLTNALWTYHNGSATRIAGTGDNAPGAGAEFTLRDLSAPAIDDAGHVAFTASMKKAGVTTNDSGLWTNVSGTLTLVGRTGDHLPGIETGAPLRYFSSPVMSPDGQLALKSFFNSNLEVDEAIWSYKDGQLQLIAREGSSAPAAPDASATYGSLSDPYSNSYGIIGFGSGVNSTVFDLTNGLWLRRPDGTVNQIWLTYTQAPDLPSGIKASSRISAVNSSGSVAYRGLLRWEQTSSASDEAIFSNRSGQMSLVVREGTQAPGTATGVVFNLLDDGVEMNDSGRILFSSHLSGPGINPNNSKGVWFADNGMSPQLLARTGSGAPGMPGYTFTGIGSLMMNNAGQIAFSGVVIGPSVGSLVGIWAQDSSGIVRLIAKAGDLLDVDDGPGSDFRTIRELKLTPGLSDNYDVDARRINDRGQMVFWASFTDNSSGLFVSNLVAVPELSSIALLVAAVCGWTSVFSTRIRRTAI